MASISRSYNQFTEQPRTLTAGKQSHRTNDITVPKGPSSRGKAVEVCARRFLLTPNIVRTVKNMYLYMLVLAMTREIIELKSGFCSVVRFTFTTALLHG